MAVEHYQSSIKRSPTGIDEGPDQITESYTPIGNRALVYAVAEQSDMKIIRCIDTANVIAFLSIVNSGKSFRSKFQFGSVKKSRTKEYHPVMSNAERNISLNVSLV